MLSAKDKLNVEDMKNLQFDRHNLHAEEFVDELIAKIKDSPDLRQIDRDALSLLQGWNKVNDPDQAVSLQGEHSDKWRWGKFHQVDFAHPLGAVKPLDLIFNAKSVSMGGGRVTVGAAGWNTENGKITLAAPWRTVIDMSDPTRSWNVVGPGQSGHVLSKWYHDQVNDWTTGQYHITSNVPNEYRKAGNELKLVPE